MRRSTPLVLAALALLLVAAPPAAAHSVDGAGATNFTARLRSIDPEVPGLDIRLVEHGGRMEITNTTGEEALVLGYQDEPYLRIGPDGVFENTRSPATYLNRDVSMTAELPPQADPEAEPEWARVGSGPTVRYHDHRLHWMADEDPEAVQAEPGRRHVVTPEQTVLVLRLGDTTVEATGELVWIPGPSSLPWLALALVLAVGTAALAVTRRWAVALAAATAVLVAVDLGHVVGTAAFPADGFGDAIGRTLGGSVVSMVGWLAGVAAVVLLLRGRSEGLFAAGVAGISIAINGGLSDVGDLSRSQLPFGGPEVLARGAVAVAIGVGAGLVIAAFLGVQRHPVALRPPAQSNPGGRS